MAPKKRRASEGAVRSSFDTTKFVSLAHQQRFHNLIRHRNTIRERGISLKEGEFDVIREEIEKRHWGELLKPSKDGCLDLIQEFYANAYTPDRLSRPSYISCVNGTAVPYDSRVLDEVLGVTFNRMFDDAYTRLQRQGWDSQSILDTLCIPGTQWVKDAQGRPKFMKKSEMLPIPKIWCTLVQSNILPCSNHSEVTVKRALIVYCIIRGSELDVSKIIASNIYETAQAAAGGLGYPGLITILCRRAGIDDPINTRVPSERPITAAYIQKLLSDAPSTAQAHQGDDPPPQHSAPITAPSTSEPTTSVSNSREFRRDQAILHLHTQNQALGSYFFETAAHFGFALAPFPQPNTHAQAFFDEVQQEAAADEAENEDGDE